MISTVSSNSLTTASSASNGVNSAGSSPSNGSSAATADPSKLPARPSDKVELSGAAKTLSKSQQKQVDDLQKRDADVHLHEQAHLAAAGGYARGGATYSYQTGPDGKKYAVGGEVNIDVGEVPNNPRATIEKEQTVQRAALAPADPSGEDRAVAAHAAQIEAKAQLELTQPDSNKNGKKTSGKGKLLDVSE